MSRPVTLAIIASPGHSGQTWLSLLIGSHTQALALGEVDVLYGVKNVNNACMLCGEVCVFWNGFHRAWSRNRNIFVELADFSGRYTLSISKMEKFRTHLADERIRVKVIRLLRDGRAVTASYLRKYPAWGYDNIVNKWVESSHQNDGWFLQMPPYDRMLLSYETLVEKTAATLRTICTFVGLEYEDAMLEYWKVKHHPVDGNRGTLSFVQRYFGRESNPGDKRFYESQDPASFRDERWRQELTAHQLSRFQAIAGELNERYGYASPGGTESLRARARSYLVYTRDRIKKSLA